MQFVANRRRYRLEMPHWTKRYLGRAIPDTLNRALRDAGYDEPFMYVDNDCRHVLAFGPPDAIRLLAREICLPLCEEPQIAMEAVDRYVRSRR